METIIAIDEFMNGDVWGAGTAVKSRYGYIFHRQTGFYLA